MESPWRLTGSIRLRLSTWNECPRVILKILSLPSSLVFWHHHPVTEHGNWTNPSFSSMIFPARNFHIYIIHRISQPAKFDFWRLVLSEKPSEMGPPTVADTEIGRGWHVGEISRRRGGLESMKCCNFCFIQAPFCRFNLYFYYFRCSLAALFLAKSNRFCWLHQLHLTMFAPDSLIRR